MKNSLSEKKNNPLKSKSSIKSSNNNQRINKEKSIKNNGRKIKSCIVPIILYFLFYIINRFFLSSPSWFSRTLFKVLDIDLIEIYLILEGKVAISMDINSVKYIIALLLPPIVIISIILIIFKAIKGGSLNNMGLKNPFDDKASILIAIFLVVMNLLISIILYKAGKLVFRDAVYLDFSLGLRVIIFVLINFIGNAFYEELASRGFLLSMLTQKIGRIKGIILVAIFDTLLHTSYYGRTITLLIVFIRSCISGYLFSRKNNLSSSFIYHSLDNFVIWLGGK
jgi:membrane protease YdiL (CAAX protease family)